MGYSRSIHGVFMGYTYVSGMCRVCVGYVSGKYRKKRDARDEINDNGDNWRGNQHPAALRGRLTAHGWHGWKRKRGRWINDNGDNIPRKSTSLRGAGYVYQQLKQQLLSTTHCAQNNTLRATREMDKRQWRQYCARINILERYAGD